MTLNFHVEWSIRCSLLSVYGRICLSMYNFYSSSARFLERAWRYRPCSWTKSSRIGCAHLNKPILDYLKQTQARGIKQECSSVFCLELAFKLGKTTAVPAISDVISYGLGRICARDWDWWAQWFLRSQSYFLVSSAHRNSHLLLGSVNREGQSSVR